MVLFIFTISYATKHRVCKPAYLVPVPSQDKLGGLCQEGMTEMGVPVSLHGEAVHPDCWCICLCYLHFAPENPEDGKMYLLVPAHLGCPRQSRESCKMVVYACVGACVRCTFIDCTCNVYLAFADVLRFYFLNYCFTLIIHLLIFSLAMLCVYSDKPVGKSSIRMPKAPTA